MDKKEMREFFEEAGYDIDDCTCQNCSEQKTCVFAWDLYNTDGDCLVNK